jgi:FtsZ-interacting cell division protein ZipA
MGADWVIVVIAIAVVLLVIAAWAKSKLKGYKLVSPIKKVEPKKRRTKTSRKSKKRKSLVIRLG